MKTISKRQLIWFLICLLCLPPCALGQQPQQSRARRAEELFGKWKSDEDGSIIEIGPAERGDNRTLALKGKHTWGGSYDGKRLQFIRNVHAGEMDGKAPLWARQEVEKEASLWWKMELTPEEDCNGLKLTGKWFRGELSWREETNPKTGEVKRSASSSGRFVNPRDVKYTRVGPGEDGEADWTSTPVILIRSLERPLAGGVLDSLHAKEPFFVEVRLPNDLAAKKRGRLVVTLKSREKGDTSTLVLRENGGVAFKRFDTLHPLTLERGSDDLPDVGQATTSAGVQPTTGRMDRLKIEREDEVDIAAEGVTATVRAFQTQVGQAVYRARVSLDELSAQNIGLMAEVSEADKAVVLRKLRLIANARRVMQLKDNPYVQLSVAVEHLSLLLDPSRWNSPVVPLKVKLVNGREVPEVEDDPKLPGVSYVSQVEKDLVYRGIANGKQQALASFTKSMAAISADIILFGIGTTGADQFFILAFGISPTGEPVDMRDRLLAGLSLGSQGLLSGSLAARQYRALRLKGQNAAKLFETEALALQRRPIPGGVAGGGRRVAGSVRVARRTDIIGAEEDLEHTKIPVSEHTLPEAKLVQKGGYHLQEFDDTCGPTVYEQMRRDVGLPARTEAENMVRTYRQKKAYQAGEGMATDGLADSLAAEQFDVRTPRGVSLGDIEVQLIKGRKVAVMLNTAAPGKKPGYHWVEVKEIAHEANGKHFVVYGDPWNGGIWKMDSCSFWNRLQHDEVVFARWGQNPRTN